ncbi:hypothetical protein Tco_1032892 [Tanacetum coccineum]|uniref:Uncharacterized protein n=1 Tax=Tanacetum coccineum TaxID=301880 RepID=A0ABQ5GD77_9ASTR
MSYEDIRPIFKRSSKKRLREDYDEDNAKKQKLEDDAEKKELRDSMDVVPRDDIAIDVEGDGSSKNYKIFSEMLDDFDRQDVLDLHRLVQERTTHDKLVLFGFNEGIHMLMMHTGIAIHMMIEKKYPLTQEMILRMLSRRLEVDQESEMAFKLLSHNWQYKSVSTARRMLVLLVNPIIYTSCIEQFWATAKVQTVNEECQLQALVDKKTVIIINTSIRSDLNLEDAGGIDCLPTATIFEELVRMGYEKPSQSTYSYKAFFSPQWKFLIHTITQYLSAKTTAWNEFSIRKQRKDIAPTKSYLKRDTPEENVATLSYDPPQSGEDRMKLIELMNLCFRIKKVGSASRVESSNDASLGAQEDASKQGRKIADLDADAEVCWKSSKDVVEKEVSVTTDSLLLLNKAAKSKAVTSVLQQLQLQDPRTLEEEKRNICSIRAQEKGVKHQLRHQKRNTLVTYFKEHGWINTTVKSKSYDEIQEMFDKEMKRVNTFVDMNTELVEGSKAKAEGSSKRASDELEQIVKDN